MNDEESHLLDYVRVLYKRRWIAVSSFLLVLGSVTVYSFTATPMYEATVQIVIENEDPNVVNFEEVVEQTQRTGEYYQTQYRILQSRGLVRRTLNTLKLWSHPEFNHNTAEGAGREIAVTLRTYTDAVAGWLTGWLVSSAAEEPGDNDEAATESESIDLFLDRLTVSPVRNSRLVHLRFRSGDRALAAAIANTHARNYIEQNLQNRLQTSKEATDWLSHQLAEQRKHVEASERALQEYRELNDAVSLEDRQNIVVQKLAPPSRVRERIACKERRRITRFGRCRTTGRRSTRCPGSCQTCSSSSRRRSWPNCSASTRSFPTSSCPGIPT